MIYSTFIETYILRSKDEDGLETGVIRSPAAESYPVKFGINVHIPETEPQGCRSTLPRRVSGKGFDQTDSGLPTIPIWLGQSRFLALVPTRDKNVPIFELHVFQTGFKDKLGRSGSGLPWTHLNAEIHIR